MAKRNQLLTNYFYLTSQQVGTGMNKKPLLDRNLADDFRTETDSFIFFSFDRQFSTGARHYHFLLVTDNCKNSNKRGF